jgi:hypothetical protein
MAAATVRLADNPTARGCPFESYEVTRAGGLADKFCGV